MLGVLQKCKLYISNSGIRIDTVLSYLVSWLKVFCGIEQKLQTDKHFAYCQVITRE